MAMITPKHWLNVSTVQARQIVRAILKQRQHVPGLSTGDIYNAALIQFPEAHQALPFSADKKGGTLPPHPEHPIRSKVYLKRHVLHEMAERGEITKIHLIRGEKNQDGIRMDDVVFARGVVTQQPELAVLNRAKQAWVWRLNEQQEPSPFGDAAGGASQLQHGAIEDDDAEALRGAWHTRREEPSPDSRER